MASEGSRTPRSACARGCARSVDALPLLAKCGELFGFQARERFYEIGTPAALAETEAFLRELAALESR